MKTLWKSELYKWTLSRGPNEERLQTMKSSKFSPFNCWKAKFVIRIEFRTFWKGTNLLWTSRCSERARPLQVRTLSKTIQTSSLTSLWSVLSVCKRNGPWWKTVMAFPSKRCFRSSLYGPESSNSPSMDFWTDAIIQPKCFGPDRRGNTKPSTRSTFPWQIRTRSSSTKASCWLSTKCKTLKKSSWPVEYFLQRNNFVEAAGLEILARVLRHKILSDSIGKSD